jgi:Arc/MetJ-type ribon-helix-helix transcriptional regulator
MSLGTPRYTFRIPDELYTRMQSQIASRNLWTRKEPWTDSDFVRTAIEEKLLKMARSRRRPGRRQAAPSPADEGPAAIATV